MSVSVVACPRNHHLLQTSLVLLGETHEHGRIALDLEAVAALFRFRMHDDAADQRPQGP